MEDLFALAASNPLWSLEEFVAQVNALLPRYLPDEKANARVREEVNARLIRHYTTEGLLDPPLKEGREARYTYHHLVQLLAARRLMTEGYGTQLVARQLQGQDALGLHGLLEERAAPTPPAEAPNPALAYLEGLSAQARRQAPLISQAPLVTQAAAPPTLTWTRLELQPGLELHIRSDVPLSPERLRALRDVLGLP